MHRKLREPGGAKLGAIGRHTKSGCVLEERTYALSRRTSKIYLREVGGGFL